ncbi:MAG: PepSY-like domain-containing protein [Bacteroidaceae bacterium]|nr:PepSY-like domain-containing protein [Bacteroidaceae bacterium]
MKKLILLIMLSLPVIVACDDDDGMKVHPNNAVLEFIDSRYPGSRLRSSEYEKNGLLEVEISHEGKIKDVYFDSQSKWVYTSWDVRRSDLPQVVSSAIDEAYHGYRIDGIDFIERDAISYYSIELERGGDNEIVVNVTPEGEILNR